MYGHFCGDSGLRAIIARLGNERSAVMEREREKKLIFTSVHSTADTTADECIRARTRQQLASRLRRPRDRPQS